MHMDRANYIESNAPNGHELGAAGTPTSGSGHALSFGSAKYFNNCHSWWRICGTPKRYHEANGTAMGASVL